MQESIDTATCILEILLRELIMYLLLSNTCQIQSQDSFKCFPTKHYPHAGSAYELIKSFLPKNKW